MSGALDRAADFRREIARLRKKLDAGKAENARLTRERDNARRDFQAELAENARLVQERDVARGMAGAVRDGSADWQARAETAEAENTRLGSALAQIDGIRNSIVARQTVNWSQHIYPLVAALNEAGFPGLSHEDAQRAVAAGETYPRGPRPASDKQSESRQPQPTEE